MIKVLVEQFVKDVTDCGLYFNNAQRVKHECLSILAEHGYPVIISKGEETMGEPILMCFQPKELVKMIDEAHQYAFTYIRSQQGVEQKLQEEAQVLEEQEESCARYYQKHGTKGEF